MKLRSKEYEAPSSFGEHDKKDLSIHILERRGTEEKEERESQTPH